METTHAKLNFPTPSSFRSRYIFQAKRVDEQDPKDKQCTVQQFLSSMFHYSPLKSQSSSYSRIDSNTIDSRGKVGLIHARASLALALRTVCLDHNRIRAWSDSSIGERGWPVLPADG